MRKILIIVLFFSVTVSGLAQNGKLDKAKESLKDKPTTASTTATGVRENRRNFRKEKPLKNLFTTIALNLTYGVVVETIFERNTEMHYASITPYPYKSDVYGNFMYADDSSEEVVTRLDITDNFVYESKNLYGNNLDLKFRFAKRFDMELDYLQLLEDTATGTDGFSLFSAMANYHRIRTQKIDFWFGLGTMYVANDVNKFGFAYSLGSEYFLKKPVALFASYKGSTISGQKLEKVTIALKLYKKQFSFSVGYHFYNLGVSDINTFGLGMGVSL